MTTRKKTIVVHSSTLDLLLAVRDADSR